MRQVQEQDAGAAPLRTEVSNVESAFTAISGPASLADVVDHLADQAVAGELSPRQAAAAIRSATRQHSGGSLAGASAGGGGEGEGAAGSPSAAVAEAGTDEVLTMDGTEGSDSVSVSGGVGRSSLAPSEEGWHQGVGSAGRAALLGGSGPAGASPDNMENIALDEEAPAAAIPEQQAEQEPSEGQQATGDTPADPAEDAASEAGAVAPPAAAPEEAPTEEHPAAAEAEHLAAPAPSAVPRTSSAGYKSQLMQQLTDDAGEGEDITVYSRDMINTDAGRAAAAAVTALQQDDATAPPPAAPADAAPAVADPQALPISNGSAGSGGFGAAAAAPAAPPAKASPRMESLSVEAGSGAAGGSGTMSTADTAAALSAINAAGAAAAPAGEQQQQVSQQQQPAQLLFPPAWYETFKGERTFKCRHAALLSSGRAAARRRLHGGSALHCLAVDSAFCQRFCRCSTQTRQPHGPSAAFSRFLALASPAPGRPALHGRRGCAGPPRGGAQRRWAQPPAGRPAIWHRAAVDHRHDLRGVVPCAAYVSATRSSAVSCCHRSKLLHVAPLSCLPLDCRRGACEHEVVGPHFCQGESRERCGSIP